MQWEIRGTRGGKPGQWKLQASSAESARAKAVAAGVTIERVKQIGDLPHESAAAPVMHTPAAPPVSAQVAETEEEEEYVPEAVAVEDEESEEEAESEWTHVAPEAAAPPVVPPVPIAYAAPQSFAGPMPSSAGPAPAYTGIVAGARVLQIFSIFFFLGALVSIVSPIVMLFLTGGFKALGLNSLVIIGSGVLSTIGLVAIGLLVRLIAAVSLAIRDIARNSYR